MALNNTGSFSVGAKAMYPAYAWMMSRARLLLTSSGASPLCTHTNRSSAVSELG